MNAKNPYKTDALLAGSSRIALLIKVYDRTIAYLELAEESHRNGEQSLVLDRQMRVQKMILGLYAGIDLEAGEVATNVARLLQFIMDQTVAKNFAAAMRIANQLRDTYVAIQDEVEQLEEAGQLPGLDIGSGIQLSV